MQKKYDTLGDLLLSLEGSGADDGRRYRAVKEFICTRARIQGIPVSGTFELTPFCNLDCKMCYVHLQKEQLGSAVPLSVETWKKLMGEAVSHGMLYAKLSGGECLAYPGFCELYLFLRSQGIEVAILTNGTLLTESMTAFLARHPPAVIQVTLYGSNEEAYEHVTGHRAFARALKGISRVREAGIPVKLAITPNSYMGSDGEALVRLADSLQIPYSINAGLAQPRKETGRQKEMHDAKTWEYSRLYKLRAQLGEGRTLIPYKGKLPKPGGNGKKQETGIRCGAGRMSFAIQWNGDMRACSILDGIVSKPLEVGFEKAWSQIHKWARDYRRPTMCGGCRYEPVCKICAAEHGSREGQGYVNTAVCDWVQGMIREGILEMPEEELKTIISEY